MYRYTRKKIDTIWLLKKLERYDTVKYIPYIFKHF